MPGQRERGQPQPRRPALGALVQPGEALAGQRDSGGGQQLLRLLEGEAQIRAPYLPQLAGQTKPVQPEARVMAARQHHPQQRRPPRDEQFELPQRVSSVKLMQVIEHEHHRPLQRAQLGRQAPNDRLPLEHRRRPSLLHERVRADRGADLADHREPEALRILLPALDRHPRDAIA